MIIVEMRPAEVFLSAPELRLADSLKRHQTTDKAICRTPPYLGAWHL
jgi:hypothetical protein